MIQVGIYNHCEEGECDVVFNGDAVVDIIDSNDASWRHEYFNGWLKHFGVNVIQLHELNEVQEKNFRAFAPYYFHDEE